MKIWDAWKARRRRRRGADDLILLKIAIICGKREQGLWEQMAFVNVTSFLLLLLVVYRFGKSDRFYGIGFCVSF